MDHYESLIEQKGPLKAIRNKIFGILGQFLLSNTIRIRFFSGMGAKIGKNVFIGKYCIIDDTFPELIKIEEDASIAFGVTIVAHDAPQKKTGRVLIRKGSYIGARAVILPGVVIGKNAIVGAGAVVTRDVEADTKVAGVPAKKIQ
jgi:acetyltransferase-like isoleucine patch superfamily enzyme